METMNTSGQESSFLDNYAAEDASALFLSKRIKRLLKFIDITDSIKLCHHLGDRIFWRCLCRWLFVLDPVVIVACFTS